MQKTAPALPGLLRLRCRFPGLVGQNCCQFPPFLALDAPCLGFGVQPLPQILDLVGKLLTLPVPFRA
jgi:hypothetical protein